MGGGVSVASSKGVDRTSSESVWLGDGTVGGGALSSFSSGSVWLGKGRANSSTIAIGSAPSTAASCSTPRSVVFDEWSRAVRNQLVASMARP
eukprot:scaffold20288_cov57-Phaeocystis_antarctica.AAC.1